MDEHSCIDAVIIWVDGSDPEWQRERAQFLPKSNTDNRTERYRDMGLLRYLFRGLETYAPWLRTVHFVTCGQKPAWLNTNAPKLHCISHTEYIPSEYLPTFNSNVIELNFHRIDSLSEQFIYFNDDMFLIDHIRPEDFFFRGLPKQSASFLPLYLDPTDTVFSGTLAKNTEVLYRNFSRADFIKFLYKHVNPRNDGLKNSLRNAKNIFMGVPGIAYSHLAVPLLKSCISDLWAAEPDVMDAVSRNRFRSAEDCSQYLIQNWQIASGLYSPTSKKTQEKYFYLPNSYKAAAMCIQQQQAKSICLNDGKFATEDDYRNCVDAITQAFELILPQKSSFEL